MSKGSPIVPVRIPQSLLHEISQCIDRRNLWTLREEWTTSSFVIAAIREKIAKMERSRRKRPRSIKRGSQNMTSTIAADQSDSAEQGSGGQYVTDIQGSGEYL